MFRGLQDRGHVDIKDGTEVDIGGCERVHEMS
jgi:hypothetical protein